MLYQLLQNKREQILKLCGEKLALANANYSSTESIELWLVEFYEELIEVVGDIKLDSSIKAEVPLYLESAARRGRDSLRLGHTISQVVHGYGALCQSITEIAEDEVTQPITAHEFNRLNLCLDVAIASAVAEFSSGQRAADDRDEVMRLGTLAHELRNALGNAMMAHRLIQRGIVGGDGSTSRVLSDSLGRMKVIIDRSLSDIRSRSKSDLEFRKTSVLDLVGEVEVSAVFDARAKGVRLLIDVPAALHVKVDRHLIIAALSNLVQNAIKFTKPDSTVQVRATITKDRVHLEVEDECGGLPEEKVEELFSPFVQHGDDRTGLGLGLSISNRAVALNDGLLSARDLPGKGCVFSIDLPLAS